MLKDKYGNDQNIIEMDVIDVYDELIILRDNCHKHGLGFSSHLMDVAAESILDALDPKRTNI